MPAKKKPKSKPEAVPVEIPLEDIQADAQVRRFTGESLAKDYAELLQEGAEFPPLVVYRRAGYYDLADGYHRYEAARQLGLASFLCYVREGTIFDQFIESVQLNARNGEPLDYGDKRTIVEKVFANREDWPEPWPTASDREIARRLGFSNGFVSRIHRIVNDTDVSESRERTDATGVGNQEEEEDGQIEDTTAEEYGAEPEADEPKPKPKPVTVTDPIGQRVPKKLHDVFAGPARWLFPGACGSIRDAIEDITELLDLPCGEFLDKDLVEKLTEIATAIDYAVPAIVDKETYTCGWLPRGEAREKSEQYREWLEGKDREAS